MTKITLTDLVDILLPLGHFIRERVKSYNFILLYLVKCNQAKINKAKLKKQIEKQNKLNRKIVKKRDRIEER